MDQQRYSECAERFPVPDGDTGTNMSLALNAAIKELEMTGSVESTLGFAL